MEGISVLTEEAELEQFVGEWNRLLQESSSGSIFLTWEWVSAWWRAYQGDRKLWILKVKRNGSLVGLAPLCRRNIRKYGLVSYRALCLIGDGSGDSDYLDIIAKEGEEEFVADAMATFIFQKKDQWDLIVLNEVPETSKNIGLLRKHLGSRVRYWNEAKAPCTYVDIPSDWDSYLRSLAPRMRTKIRSTLKNLEENYKVGFVVCREEAELNPRLKSLFDLHNSRWEQSGKNGVFVSEAKRRFYQDMSQLFLSRKWLRFYSLIVNGCYVAHQFCLEYQNRMFLLQEGYDPKWTQYSVGNVLRAYVFRDCIEGGLATYDFLGGVTRHKLSWGGQVKQSVRISIGCSKLKNGIFFYCPKVIDMAKDSLKKWLPNKVLRPIRSLHRILWNSLIIME